MLKSPRAMIGRFDRYFSFLQFRILRHSQLVERGANDPGRPVAAYARQRIGKQEEEISSLPYTLITDNCISKTNLRNLWLLSAG